MSDTQNTHQQIDELVKGNDVVLFMKGTRAFPQCGFSATVVQILDDLVEGYETVNVLASAEMRSGIKAYSDWPTIPQLYVKGEFIGGSDIVRAMYASGELHTKLGVKAEEVSQPTVSATDAAARVLREAAAGERFDTLRLGVGPGFQYSLAFAPQQDGDFVCESNGVTFLLDRGSAKRADGLVLDYDEAKGGFSIDNPNEPPTVKQIGVKELQAALAADPGLKLFDVRTDEERAGGIIPGSVQLTETVKQEAMALPKDTPLYFTCRSGGRSQQAAETFIRAGFSRCFNVEGGILAWSREIDPSIPQY